MSTKSRTMSFSARPFKTRSARTWLRVTQQSKSVPSGQEKCAQRKRRRSWNTHQRQNVRRSPGSFVDPQVASWPQVLKNALTRRRLSSRRYLAELRIKPNIMHFMLLLSFDYRCRRKPVTLNRRNSANMWQNWCHCLSLRKSALISPKRCAAVLGRIREKYKSLLLKNGATNRLESPGWPKGQIDYIASLRFVQLF